jgi:polysaccharide biosynthesis protein VpsM
MSSRWRLPACVGLVLLGVLGSASVARAQGLQLGPFRLLPSLELSGEYDDNILLTKDDTIDDFIWHITPGVVIELPARKYAIRLGYQADILRYTDNTDLDTVHHNALADARVNFNFGLGLRLTDRFLITDDFSGFPVPELTERVERWENTLDVGADYTVRERYTFDVNYRWCMVDYKDDPEFDQFDRDDHTIGGTFFYRVFPKTSVLGEVQYNIVRYDEPAVAADRDSDSWRFLVGLKGDITAKTTILLKIGWEWKDYDNAAREDWDGVIAEGNVIWKYREPSDVRIFGGRANVESLFEGTNYYVTTYGGAEVRHFLSERLTLRVRGLGGINQYPEDITVGTESGEREDVFFEAGVALKYQMRRWVAFEVAYGFLKLDSNFDEFDYTDNRVKVSVLFTY